MKRVASLIAASSIAAALFACSQGATGSGWSSQETHKGSGGHGGSSAAGSGAGGSGGDDTGDDGSGGTGGSSSAGAGGSASAGSGGAGGSGGGAGSGGSAGSGAGGAGGSAGAGGGGGSGGSVAAPTWSQIYQSYLQGNPGQCVGCHGEMSSASGAYSWLQGMGYISGAQSTLVANGQSCLSWYGGNMPQGGPSNVPQAVSDMNAWAAAGAQNN